MARNLHIKQSYQRAMAKAEDFFAKAKDLILPDTLFTPALAPAFAGPAIPPFIRFPEKAALPNVSYFSTNGMPKPGTAARRIMEWRDVETPKVSIPPLGSERPPRYSISEDEAQKEIASMLNGRAPCHEYIAHEAAMLCGHPLAARYALHIVVGATAEDFVFAPGESFIDLYASEPKREFKSRKELTQSLLPEPSRLPPFFQGILTLASRIGAFFTGGKSEKDELNRPYFAHFYDPSRPEGRRGLTLMGGDISFKSARERARMYWDVASHYYTAGQMPEAFYALGHLVHLVSDMQVPAHVHNDIHGPNVVLGKPDSLEQWLTRADYPHPDRKSNEPNVRIWRGRQLAAPVPNHRWYERNVHKELDALIGKAASEASAFKSVDREGTRPGQEKTGRLYDGECFQQAGHLIPGAMAYSAQVIANFIDYHERGGRLTAAGWAPNKAT